MLFRSASCCRLSYFTPMKTKKRERNPKDPSPAGKPIPLAIPEGLLTRLDDVADRMDMSRANVIRMTMKIGLEQLSRVDYDIARLVVDANNQPPEL